MITMLAAIMKIDRSTWGSRRVKTSLMQADLGILDTERCSGSNRRHDKRLLGQPAAAAKASHSYSS